MWLRKAAHALSFGALTPLTSEEELVCSRCGERIPLLNRCPLQGQLRMRISIPSSSNTPTSYPFPGDQISSIYPPGFHQVDHWVFRSTSLSSQPCVGEYIHHGSRDQRRSDQKPESKLICIRMFMMLVGNG